jgi:hypothetical protein
LVSKSVRSRILKIAWHMPKCQIDWSYMPILRGWLVIRLSIATLRVSNSWRATRKFGYPFGRGGPLHNSHGYVKRLARGWRSPLLGPRDRLVAGIIPRSWGPVVTSPEPNISLDQQLISAVWYNTDRKPARLLCRVFGVRVGFWTRGPLIIVRGTLSPISRAALLRPCVELSAKHRRQAAGCEHRLSRIFTMKSKSKTS